MKIRIDLKIFIFLALFYITKQIDIYFIIMFFCIIHELGHIIIGLVLGLRPDKLEINPCGLSISFKTDIKSINFKLRKGNLLELKKIITALAGPTTSLILAILYCYLTPLYISKQDAIYANILILIFNLLPIYPLDGGRILKGLLHIELGNKEAQIITNKISNILMITISIISSIAVYYFKNISIFIICIFLWIITIKQNKKFNTKMRIYDIIQKK